MFKVGDRVRTIKNVSNTSYYDKYIGDVGTIERYESDGRFNFMVRFPSGSVVWNEEEELELVTEFKIGDKVILKENELSKHEEIYKRYNHLIGRILTIKCASEENGKYTLLEVENYNKWQGIGIDGKYINVIPIFTRDMLEKVEIQTQTYDEITSINMCASKELNKKTNKIKRTKSNKETIIEYDIIDRNIKFKVSGDPIHIAPLLKILLHETELYNYTYKRVSPYKLTRTHSNKIHKFNMTFIDIKDNFEEKNIELMETVSDGMNVHGEFDMFIPDFLELACERYILVQYKDTFKINRSLDKAMEYCSYMKSKPSVNELLKQGYTVPNGYKKI